MAFVNLAGAGQHDLTYPIGALTYSIPQVMDLRLEIIPLVLMMF